MTPPRGILPRSVRARYHQAKRERDASAGAREAPAVAPERDGSANGLAPEASPPDPLPAAPAAVPGSRRRLLRSLGVAAAVVLCAVAGIVVGSVVSSSGDSKTGSTAATQPPASHPRTTTLPPATADEPIPSKTPLALSAGATYDPSNLGAGGSAAAVVDGKARTAWRTTEAGVGVYVKLRSGVSPALLTITTTTPGFAAQVLASHHPDLPAALSGWRRLATVRDVKRRKAVKLAARGRTYRHVLLWVTALPPGGGPVKVTGLQLR